MAFKLGSPSGLTAVVLQTQALFTIGYAHLLLGERTTRQQRTGFAIAALGIGTIAIGAARGTTAGFAVAPLLLVIGAAASWGLANVVLRRVAVTDVLGFVVWSSLVPPRADVGAVVGYRGSVGVGWSWRHLTWLGVASVLYVAWPVGVLSGWAWGSLLSRHAAARFAPVALLVPVVSLIGGALVYGERPSGSAIAGSGLILAGLSVAIQAGETANPSSWRHETRKRNRRYALRRAGNFTDQTGLSIRLADEWGVAEPRRQHFGIIA